MGESKLIVSVHLPKTAGTSFAAALEEHFGTALLRDYADLPINTPPSERHQAAVENCLANAKKDFPGIKCIHGHFLPLKYLLLSDRRDVAFVTWMRDPVTRALSNYYYWIRSFNPAQSPPLHHKMITEKWSLERFCLGPELRNVYSQFLYGFPLEYFSFIGVTEHYDDDMAFFVEQYMDPSTQPPRLKSHRLNVGDKAGDGYDISESLRNQIEQFHSADMDLYRRALEMRRTRGGA